MAAAPNPLRELVSAELSRPAPDAARLLTEAIRSRHGDALAAVIFYGSCLRKETHEGVLDFYALVDSYASAYPSRALAVANSLLPPNVFYLEQESPLGRLRAKFAVLSTADFSHAVGPRCLHSYIWARFAQPALLVYARDDSARDAAISGAEQAVLTLVSQLVPLLPAEEDGRDFAPAEFWRTAFRETYAAELRAEAPESIDGLYFAAPERYDAALRAALRSLEQAGRLELVAGDGELRVRMDPRRRRRARRSWRRRRPLAKALGVARLLKTAGTFGDWLPYAIWKLERHSGVSVELSERQRRWPLVWGWPVLFRLLRQRNLR